MPSGPGAVSCCFSSCSSYCSGGVVHWSKLLLIGCMCGAMYLSAIVKLGLCCWNVGCQWSCSAWADSWLEVHVIPWLLTICNV